MPYWYVWEEELIIECQNPLFCVFFFYQGIAEKITNTRNTEFAWPMQMEAAIPKTPQTYFIGKKDAFKKNKLLHANIRNTLFNQKSPRHPEGGQPIF